MNGAAQLADNGASATVAFEVVDTGTLLELAEIEVVTVYVPSSA
jgi:hypothetical protein